MYLHSITLYDHIQLKLCIIYRCLIIYIPYRRPPRDE